MSHVTTGEMCITDLGDVEKAAEALGGKLVRGQKTHKWFGVFLDDWQDERAAVKRGIDAATFGTCDHAIVLQDAAKDDYEVGLVKRRDGKGWDAIYDTCGAYGRRVEEKLGKGLSKLKTECGIHATKRTYAELGYMVEEGQNDQGRRQVRVWK